MPDLALAGLRVIDLSQGIAGPYCTRLLADLGAEVIKVEPPEGDYARRLGPFPDDIPDPDRAGLFVHLNSGKKSLTLDVQAPSGCVVLRKLLAEADLLVESGAPGHLAALGLGYDDLKAEFPSLMYCSITPFGQTGPYRDFKGNSLACMALSGLMYVTGDPDREPLCSDSEPADYFTALNAWVAILAALELRAATDQGQHLDVSMLESLGAADEGDTAMYWSLGGAIRRRHYANHPTAYPQEIYPCRNGYIAVVASERAFPAPMARLLEDPNLERHPLFVDGWQRPIQWQQFEEILRPYLLEHDWQEILARAQRLGLPFAAVHGPQTLLESEHLKERGFFQEVKQPGLGRLPLASAPFRMSETPLRSGPAPLLGEHSPDLLLDLGYSPEETMILRERGIT